MDRIRNHFSICSALAPFTVPSATEPGLEAIQRYNMKEYHQVIRLETENERDVSVLMAVTLSYLQTNDNLSALNTINRALILDPSRPILFYIRG